MPRVCVLGSQLDLSPVPKMRSILTLDAEVLCTRVSA
ncbi:hypothetical protein LINPERPRIM_LOCUS19007 [Linum perenne]